MSDTIVKLIPNNHTYRAPEAAILNAVSVLKRTTRADDIQYNLFDAPHFVDCGENYGQITCPHCGKTVSGEAWREWMNKASSTGFSNLKVTLPCCGAAGSLDKLEYGRTCGFATFSIEVANPHQGITPSALRAVERAFGGIPFRQVVARH